jgi:hypothetical protein
MTQIKMTKESVLAKLKEQLVVAKAHDEKLRKQHKADEAAWDKELKAAVTTLSKQPLGDLIKRVQNKWGGTYLELRLDTPLANKPTCPLSVAAQVQRAIDIVTLSEAKTYTMTEGTGVHDGLFKLLTWVPDPPRKDVC